MGGSTSAGSTAGTSLESGLSPDLTQRALPCSSPERECDDLGGLGDMEDGVEWGPGGDGGDFDLFQRAKVLWPEIFPAPAAAHALPSAARPVPPTLRERTSTRSPALDWISTLLEPPKSDSYTFALEPVAVPGPPPSHITSECSLHQDQQQQVPQPPRAPPSLARLFAPLSPPESTLALSPGPPAVLDPQGLSGPSGIGTAAVASTASSTLATVTAATAAAATEANMSSSGQARASPPLGRTLARARSYAAVAAARTQDATLKQLATPAPPREPPHAGTCTHSYSRTRTRTHARTPIDSPTRAAGSLDQSLCSSPPTSTRLPRLPGAPPTLGRMRSFADVARSSSTRSSSVSSSHRRRPSVLPGGSLGRTAVLPPGVSPLWRATSLPMPVASPTPTATPAPARIPTLAPAPTSPSVPAPTTPFPAARASASGSTRRRRRRKRPTLIPPLPSDAPAQVEGMRFDTAQRTWVRTGPEGAEEERLLLRAFDEDDEDGEAIFASAGDNTYIDHVPPHPLPHPHPPRHPHSHSHLRPHPRPHSHPSPHLPSHVCRPEDTHVHAHTSAPCGDVGAGRDTGRGAVGEPSPPPLGLTSVLLRTYEQAEALHWAQMRILHL